MEISAVDILLRNNGNTLQALYLEWCKHQFPAFVLYYTRATQIYSCLLIMFVLRSVYIWITFIKFLVLGPGNVRSPMLTSWESRAGEVTCM